MSQIEQAATLYTFSFGFKCSPFLVLAGMASLYMVALTNSINRHIEGDLAPMGLSDFLLHTDGFSSIFGWFGGVFSLAMGLGYVAIGILGYSRSTRRLSLAMQNSEATAPGNISI